MNDQERDERHLEFACGDAMNWFRNVPKLTRSFVIQRLVDSVTSQFRGHEVLLWKFEVKELSPRWFQVKVNDRAVASMDIGKEVSDE